MIGFDFVGQHNNLEQKTTVKDWINEGKFIVEFIDGGEELTTHYHIINKYSQKDEELSDLYFFMDLIDHRKKGNQYIVQVKWDRLHTKGVGEPKYYLGGDVTRTKDAEEKRKTTLSTKTYMKNICDNVERTFNTTLKNYHSSLEGGYHPELDISEMIDKDDISKYRMLIGSLVWLVNLERVGNTLAAITLARYSCVRRQGYF